MSAQEKTQLMVPDANGKNRPNETKNTTRNREKLPFIGVKF